MQPPPDQAHVVHAKKNRRVLEALASKLVLSYLKGYAEKAVIAIACWAELQVTTNRVLLFLKLLLNC